MGFFSSIGKVFKKVAAPVAGVLGTVLGGPAGGVAGAAMADAVWNGGSSGSSGSDWQKSAYGDQMAFAREQFDFNKQYIQNQMQWRVEDAKKAGLHPMAALGLNGASFSGVSMPSIPNIQDSIYDPVELGQSIAYASAKAKTAKQQEEAFDLSRSLSAEQIKGVQLDNELKQLEIMSLVSRLTQTGPAAPSLNPKTLIGGQNDATVGNSFSSGTTPLLSLSRVGNTLMGHINPDISDSLTEDMIRNQLANLNAEFQSGRITPEVYSHLTKHERDLIKKGDLVLEYSFPSTWRLRYTSRMKPKYANDNREVGGKLNFYHMKY